MNLILTIPITTDTAIPAETLLDFIYQLNQRIKKGHALLVYTDISEESQMRIRIAADLCFESFDEIVAPTGDQGTTVASAISRRNRNFLAAAEYCQKTYRTPWLYLDGTAVPLRQGWLENLEKAYTDQARRYMGTHLRQTAESKDVFLMPSSIYHQGTFNDCNQTIMAAMEVPFEISCGPILAPKSTKSKLIQPLKIVDETDFEKVWAGAEVVVGDATGAFIEKLRADGVHHPTFHHEPSPVEEPIEIMFNNRLSGNGNGDTPKLDKRTKAYKQMMAQQKA